MIRYIITTFEKKPSFIKKDPDSGIIALVSEPKDATVYETYTEAEHDTIQTSLSDDKGRMFQINKVYAKS